MFLSDNLITLRAIEIEDSPLLFEMINDPEVEATVLGWSCRVLQSHRRGVRCCCSQHKSCR